jgi:hypothetical protein
MTNHFESSPDDFWNDTLPALLAPQPDSSYWPINCIEADGTFVNLQHPNAESNNLSEPEQFVLYDPSPIDAILLGTGTIYTDL